LALALAAVLWPQGAGANPDGGTVVGGAATIVETSPSRLDILQTTDKAIIDWQSFSIGEAEHTNFSQPSIDSVTLNRVVGGDLSTIAGQLSANGYIVLINPNGVIFTSTSRIDVHGLIASTSDLGDDDFMDGRLDFSAAVDSSSFVINRGQITAAEGGLVALVAPWVENSGVIAARRCGRGSR
jgi:filamentous hemagglutinin family protein